MAGWAEVGAARTEFSAAHPRGGSRVSAPEAAALSRQFLETTGAGAIYESVLFRHREWQRRDVERAERELKGAKDKVSRALDGLG